MIGTPSPIKNNLKTKKTNPYDEHFYCAGFERTMNY